MSSREVQLIEFLTSHRIIIVDQTEVILNLWLTYLGAKVAEFASFWIVCDCFAF